MKYFLIAALPVLLHFWLVGKFGYPTEVENETQIEHLKEITAQMHPYNSARNIAIQRYLEGVISKLSAQHKSITLHKDLVNITTSTNPIIFYESSNVIASIKGESSTAILVSAHYDSMFESYGATDDGVAISAMLTCLEDLANEKLKYTIIFLFNNNEESGLLGATAFRSHQLWPSIKAFLNLEGTGVAESSRSFLFRANSFKLVQRLMDSQKFPHSSIFAATIMKFVKSDTDYRIYLQGGKPGVDMAFYSKRYLYHTELDDFAHVSVKSMAYMLENLKSSLLSLSKDNLVDNLKSESQEFNTFEYTNQTLPVPDYLFYDRFGSIGNAVTNADYQLQLSGLLLFVLVICLISMLLVFSGSGLRVGLRTLIYPSAQSFFYVSATFISSFLLIFLTSLVKTKFNPGSTYGFAELSLISTYFLTFLVISIFSEFSPVFRNFDRISKKTDAEASKLILRERKIESQHDFLQIGLFLFWAFTAFLAYLFSKNGYTMFFFFFDFSLYSSLGLFITAIMQVFTEYRLSALITIFANFIPTLFIWDTLDIGLWSLPSFIGEGIPDYGIDCVLGFYVILHTISLMPLLPTAKLTKFSFIGFLGTWVVLMVWEPFGRERPVHYGYEETFNLDENFTRVNMMVMKTLPVHNVLKRWRNEGVHIPKVEIAGNSFYWNETLTPKFDEKSISMEAQLKMGVLEGFITGSNGSRACEIEPGDFEIKGDWILQGSKSKLLVGNTIMVLKRDIANGGMKIPFKFWINATTVDLIVHCHHHIYLDSPRFKSIHSQMPNWSIRQLKEKPSRSFGDLKLLKVLKI